MGRSGWHGGSTESSGSLASSAFLLYFPHCVTSILSVTSCSKDGLQELQPSHSQSRLMPGLSKKEGRKSQKAHSLAKSSPFKPVPLTSDWPEISNLIECSCRKGWEIQSFSLVHCSLLPSLQIKSSPQWGLV